IGTELAELHSLEENFLWAEQWKADYRAHAKWEHYMQCDGSPDPAVPQEINTFMSLWQENKNEDIEFVIKKGNQVLNLIEKLNFLLLDTPPNELMEEVIVQYQESILELQSLLHQKYNEATEHLLKVSKLCILVVAPLQVATDEKEEELIGENVVDLHQFTPVGGVYFVDALKLPPQAKQIKGWTMVELLDVGLETYPYPPESEETEDATYPRVGVILRLLDSVIFFEEPMVARWDSAGKQWRTDGISDIQYKMKEKQISFEMDTFYTITLIQDAHLNMPYQSWELRPNGTDELLFTIVTAFAEVQMQIKGNQCMLSSIIMDGSEQLSHLTGKWTSPIDLTVVLKKAGVNIFPSDYSYKYVCVNKKTPLAEVTSYQQMALVASAFAFSWSKWNLASGQDQVVFKVSEHLKTDAVKDEDWSLYMFNGQRAQRLKISETSEAFSEDLAENTEFHSTLYHLIKDFASEEAIEKVKKASCLFIDAIYQLLITTRVLTYS
uniref:Dynein axonemal intermediate chain 7 n=1 Tax=Chelonoidis abingdonii TaxID=106734 RepID=A0A8C0GAE5_CHEAB